MPKRVPAEVFPPGEFVRDELEARSWTQSDLAEILGRPVRTVNEVVTGKRSVTPETARGLAAAFGTSAEVWMNLQTAWELYKAERDEDQQSAVARRATLFSKAPIKEMIRRGWLEGSDNIDVLEKRFCAFFEIRDPSQELDFQAAARMAASPGNFSPPQMAWIFRAKHLATMVGAKSYSRKRLPGLLKEIKKLLLNPEDVRRVPSLLADFGIRMVVVEALSKTKIDGAFFWLRRSPVIAMSMRYPRVDYFWYTLMHEIGHISNRDGIDRESESIDVDLTSRNRTKIEDQSTAEIAADKFATEFLVPQEELEDFIARVSPLYSKTRIRNFAKRIKVHPSIVVGQLQHRGEIDWSHSREMLRRVREEVTNSTLSDGWGHFAPPNPTETN